ncbi:MAG: PLDc N-terminal domain-containing protein [Bacillota bacterium]
MERFIELLPILLPVFFIELSLRIYALFDIWKKERKTNAFPKWGWTIIVALIGFGWIFYLLLGRWDEDA